MEGVQYSVKAFSEGSEKRVRERRTGFHIQDHFHCLLVEGYETAQASEVEIIFDEILWCHPIST